MKKKKFRKVVKWKDLGSDDNAFISGLWLMLIFFIIFYAGGLPNWTLAAFGLFLIITTYIIIKLVKREVYYEEIKNKK